MTWGRRRSRKRNRHRVGTVSDDDSLPGPRDERRGDGPVETSRYSPAEELKKGRSVDAVVGEIVRRAQSSRLPTSRLPRGFDRNGGSLSWTRSAARKSLGR